MFWRQMPPHNVLIFYPTPSSSVIILIGREVCLGNRKYVLHVLPLERFGIEIRCALLLTQNTFEFSMCGVCMRSFMPLCQLVYWFCLLFVPHVILWNKLSTTLVNSLHRQPRNSINASMTQCQPKTEYDKPHEGRIYCSLLVLDVAQCI